MVIVRRNVASSQFLGPRRVLWYRVVYDDIARDVCVFVFYDKSIGVVHSNSFDLDYFLGDEPCFFCVFGVSMARSTLQPFRIL